MVARTTTDRILFTFNFKVRFPRQNPNVAIRNNGRIFQYTQMRGVTSLRQYVFVCAHTNAYNTAAYSMNPNGLRILSIIQNSLHMEDGPYSQNVAPGRLPIFESIKKLFYLKYIDNNSQIQSPTIQMRHDGGYHSRYRRCNGPRPIDNTPNTRKHIQRYNTSPRTRYRSSNEGSRT